MRNPVSLLAGRLGIRGAGRATLATSVALLMMGSGITALVMGPGDLDFADGLQKRVGYIDGAVDSDLDGLPDAVENLVGSDPRDRQSLGGAPDGWLHHWYGDLVTWEDPRFIETRALVPPTDQLPEPLRTPGALRLPTLAEVFAAEERHRDAEADDYAWWLTNTSLDPREWDNVGDGIADAWLLGHDLDPLDARPGDPAPGDPSMTLVEKYERGLSPTTRDTDGDGLLDIEEITGVARFGGLELLRFSPTDPLRFSTRADGIADGYVVRYLVPGGSDPLDPTLADSAPAGDGVTVREAHHATLRYCRLHSTPCDWRSALDAGRAIDPTKVDTLGDGVPDAWSLRDPHGVADPLTNATKQIIHSTRDWDQSPLHDRPSDPLTSGILLDALNPAPPRLNLTLADLYAYGRPSTWNETTDGPWWQGLPTLLAPGDGSLPAAVALRGWNIQLDTQLGRHGEQPPDPQSLVTMRAHADPRGNDADGDGLLDIEEYYGVTLEGDPFPRTDPSNPDTDGDGLHDASELEMGTDPARRDTSGSSLTDGEEWFLWTTRALNAGLSGIPPDLLGPRGDLDGDGVTNIMDWDSDGDGLSDGVEVHPNRFASPSIYVRPDTDPARPDTDDDALPDWWEVQWSVDDHYECPECRLHDDVDRNLVKWPLDPSNPLSFEGMPSAADPFEKADNDADVNLAGDDVRVITPTTDRTRHFSNLLAYRYDLNPYLRDTRGDGIPDMFAIHWGVEAVPPFAVEAAKTQPGLAWALQERDHLQTIAAERGGNDLAGAVVINPHTHGGGQVGPQSNLMKLFAGREKGTWVYTVQSQSCGLGTRATLPSDGPTSEAFDALPDRSSLPALQPDRCWTWSPYPLATDIAVGTNPWTHDSSGSGLPDAWVHHYGLSGVTMNQRLPTHLQRGCDDDLAASTGLEGPVDGSSSFCLTYGEAYARGLNPTGADTDGGGLPDWQEIKVLGLDPLDHLDDRGEEDWDGDGIINAVEIATGLDLLAPDTDGDGLLDGDHLGARYAVDQNVPDEDLPFLRPTQGFGNLCLPGPGHLDHDDGAMVPNMEHRPAVFGGPLTHKQLFDLYVERGILHDEGNRDRCREEDTVLFKREGLAEGQPPTQVVRGAGGASSSSNWDTSGDGISDGWKVYWADRTTDSVVKDALRTVVKLETRPLEPQDDPDDDFVYTLHEYGLVTPTKAFDWQRPSAPRWPADWDETRDGPWWAGLDPTRPDTDDNAQWFASLSKAEDRIDHDNDNDGVPDRYDPFPSIDHHNVGIIRWNEATQRYDTDHHALWDALAARHRTSLLDGDGDEVPDFLDRFRVQVQVIEILDAEGDTVDGATKGVGQFTVRGTVVVDEPEPEDGESTPLGSPPPTSDGDGVGGITVKAMLRDGNGFEAVVGFGFTQPDGTFEFPSRVHADLLPVTVPDEGATVAGRVLEGGVALLSSPGALRLEPGVLSLRVEAEAGDPDLQPLTLPAGTHVRAHKQAPFLIPDGLPPPEGSAPPTAQDVTFVALADNGQPDPQRRSVVHGAIASFPASSASSPFTLRATSEIVDLQAPPVRLGDPLQVAGKLRDKALAPLQDQVVKLEMMQGGSVLDTKQPTTVPDGTFTAAFPTGDLAPGAFTIRASALLDAEFLTDPADVETASLLSEDTTWGDIVLNDTAAPGNGALMPPQGASPLDPRDDLRLQARLLDHLGDPVSNRDVKISLLTPDGAVVHPELEDEETDELGWMDATLPPLPDGVPASFLLLRWTQETVTSQDEREGGELTVRFIHPVEVHVPQSLETPVGEEAIVSGTLLRWDGIPVADDGARFRLTSSDGQEHILQGTDADGVFRFPVNSSIPEEANWTVHFEPPGTGPLSFLAPASSDILTVRHIGEPVLGLQPAGPALRGDDVPMRGSLTLRDGTPLPDVEVLLHWTEGPNGTIIARTNNLGAFTAALPAQPTEGTHVARANTNATPLAKAAWRETPVPVLVPTVIHLRQMNVTFQPDGAPSGPLASGNLTDDDGLALTGRRIAMDFLFSGDPALRTNTTSDETGHFIVTAADAFPAEPGTWRVVARYAGDDLEAPSDAETELQVHHQARIDIQRAPSSLEPGATYALAGRILSSTPVIGNVHLRVSLGPTVIGQSVTGPDGSWSLPFTGPVLLKGTHNLSVTAEAPPGFSVEAASLAMVVTAGAEAHITEKASNGARILNVDVKAPDNLLLEGLEAVLVRRNGDGAVVETRVARLDHTGQATVEMTGSGTVELLSLRDPELRLTDVTYERSVEVVTTSAPRAWLPWVAASLAATAVAGVMLYAAWWTRYRRDLRRAFLHSQQVLLDPSTSPAEAIRLLYLRLLDALATAGYKAEEEETVRDIAERATREFRLPKQPMAGITKLFEHATYSDHELSANDRGHAIHALRALSTAVGFPVMIRRTTHAVPLGAGEPA